MQDNCLEKNKDQVRISVRNLVEFILRSGDIDNRHQSSAEGAMQEGSRIHRMIQKKMGSDYRAEVALKYFHDTENYTLVLEGRADGIIESKEEITIDEIKGTYRDIHKMREATDVHVAQAKCYAFMYSVDKGVQVRHVRMTYCNIETEEIRYFYEDFTFQELEHWFLSLIDAYLRWSDYSWNWKQIRNQSIEAMDFPVPYREGQRELVSYVYQTIYHKRKLFIEAPTGVGKTISTIFPSLKAMSKGMGDKLFYFTAKTITRTVAEETLGLLRNNGLKFNSVILTAKEKICFCDQVDCNPDSCPYANGHFDRINDAIYELLTHEESYTREMIEEYAMKFQVCPFEMCLDVSLFCDAVICDYNYLFDPHIYLKRFFGDSISGEYIFLIDEAHNLLERGREMYSASVVKEDLLELKQEIGRAAMSIDTRREIEGQMTLGMTDVSEQVSDKDEIILTDENIGKNIGNMPFAEKIIFCLDKCNKALLALKRECENYQIVTQIDDFVNAYLRLNNVLGEYLEEVDDSNLPFHDEILKLYFDSSHFLEIYERVDENYVVYTQINEDGSFYLKLLCVNPGVNLEECMRKGRSTMLFSATLLPIQYYKTLLGGDAMDYEVYAKSVFHPEKRAILIASDVTSKYTRRSEEEFKNIARYIYEIVKSRSGNYMVFCPSYSFLQQIYDIYLENFMNEDTECIIQQDYMSEEGREDFLAKFAGNNNCDFDERVGIEIEYDIEEHTLIGFCVLGGIFGEGIDLKNDSLIGAIIVGTGIPQICNEREILKNYFDEDSNSGFDYAYRYPGMNKVLQAAGRVIRTMEDVGIIALLDERFLQLSYRKMFPRECETFDAVTEETVADKVEKFWDSWSKYIN